MAKKKNITAPSALRANAKYRAQFKYIQLRVTDSQKDAIEGSLEGKSMNQYILDLIRADLKKKGVELP